LHQSKKDSARALQKLYLSDALLNRKRPVSPAYTEQGSAKIQTLGANIPAGHRPQGIVPVDHWQSAETTGDWTLVGCTVSPAFSLDGFNQTATKVAQSGISIKTGHPFAQTEPIGFS
jgi:predicted cupin superfamily sugar epimerase